MDGQIPSRLRLAPLAVLSPRPMLAGTPLKAVEKGECERFEERSGYSPDFDLATVEGKPGSTSSRYSWDRAAATRGPYTGHPIFLSSLCKNYRLHCGFVKYRAPFSGRNSI